MRAPRLRPLATLAALTAPLALAACGGDEGPPPKVAHESAGTQVKRVAERWGDTVEEEGFLENDPNGVLQLHVVTTRKLTLGDGAAASLRIDRDETFQTKLGTFRCKAGGTLSGSAAYAWQAGEAEVRVRLPPAELPRTCEPAGFPVTTRSLGAAEMLFVLRSDRLVGKSSAGDRTVLLPLQ